ncbi:hypothetical protein OROHE_024304 [Orobanche hederae]
MIREGGSCISSKKSVLFTENDFEDDFFTKASFCLPKACIPPVQDQGNANCCYAFVVLNCMYVDLIVHKGEGFQGSVQEFMDCLHLYYPHETIGDLADSVVHGYGNNFPNAFKYVGRFGVSLDEDYPFGGICGDCLKDVIGRARTIRIEKFGELRNHSQAFRMLKKGHALAGCIIATRTLSHWDEERIYTLEDEIMDDVVLSGNISHHAITLIGCGEENGIEYYIAQNTAGEDWGFHGCFKVEATLVTNIHYVVGCRVVES